MKIITTKAALQPLIDDAIAVYNAQGIDAFVAVFHSSILQCKVKFPALEYAAAALYKAIPAARQLEVTDKIIALHTVGGNVIAGMILQLRLPTNSNASIDKAIAYIIEGNQWYVCDIIGERVMGHALLTMSEQTMPILKELAAHTDKWIVRAVGVAAHYAVKKGLKKIYVDELFRLLLQLRTTTDHHTRKGVGWAVKTIAKFHPDVIDRYREDIESDATKQWFKTKIRIGTGRTSKYAHRYTS